jgi:hypothetical protein
MSRQNPRAVRQEKTIVRCAIYTRKSTEDGLDYVSPEASSSRSNGGCPGPRIRSICTSQLRIRITIRYVLPLRVLKNTCLNGIPQ